MATCRSHCSSFATSADALMLCRLCTPPGGHASLHYSAQPNCVQGWRSAGPPPAGPNPPTQNPASAVWAVQAGGLPVSQGALHAGVLLSSCLGTKLSCSAGWGRAWRPWLVACPSTLRRMRSRCCARWPGACPWAPQMRHGGRTAFDGPTSLARSSASRCTSGGDCRLQRVFGGHCFVTAGTQPSGAGSLPHLKRTA